MRRAVIAAMMLIIAACSSGDVVETTSEPATREPAVPTTLPTTEPASAAASPPATTPTAISVPTREPLPTAAPATAVPASEPTPTVVVEPAPAEPVRPTAVPPPPTPNESAEVQASNGAEVYTLTCARCHAENGTGSDRARGLLGVGSRYTTSAMIAELTTGHPFTFGFADKLSADEIASVVAYVKATFP